MALRSIRQIARTRDATRLRERVASSPIRKAVAAPLRYGAIAIGGGLILLGDDIDISFRSMPYHGVSAILAIAGFAAGIACLIFASMAVSIPSAWRQTWFRYRQVALALVMALTVDSVLVFALAIGIVFSGSSALAYQNDVIAFAHVNAELVLAGKNPYVDDAAVLRTSMRRFPLAPPTPLRRGVFGSGYDYPTAKVFDAAVRQYVATPEETHPEFDPRTMHSYPALAFLIYVPMVWAGVRNILVLHLAVYGILFAWLVWLAPRGYRRWAMLTAATAMVIQPISVVKDTEVICAALLLAAWHYRDQRWLGAILLGVACAFKQYCWLFVPFFAMDILLAQGWRESARRTAIAMGAFLLPNLPFIVGSPGSWWQSLWLPMSEPLFPMGSGIVLLSIDHVLPYGPPILYGALELATLVGALWAYAHWQPWLRESALLLALVPLIFAFRSPPNYFAFAPWLALYAANRLYASRQAGPPRWLSPGQAHSH